MVRAAFEFKGSAFSLPVFQLHTHDLQRVQEELQRRMMESQQFFRHAPLVVDLSSSDLRESDNGDSIPRLDMMGLVRILRDAALLPVGVIHATPEMEADALEAGMAVLHASAQHGHQEKRSPSRKRPVARTPTMVVGHPVRAGQQIYAQGGDLVVLAAVNPGAEVAADGDIHVYGPMRGKALAGAQGDMQANIFCLAFAGEMLVIAGHYRTFDHGSAQARGTPIQAWLENEQLMLAPIDCL